MHLKRCVVIHTKGRFTLGVKAVKSWGQLDQYLVLLKFELVVYSLFVYSLIPRPFVGPQSMRVPFVSWEPSQGQHFKDQIIQLFVGLDS
jgi:hypothetical protein